MVTHWSNQFTFRRRAEIGTTGGKPSLTVDSDLLELLGLKPGDDVIITVTDGGSVLINKSPI